jgi:hypothetical protein
MDNELFGATLTLSSALERVNTLKDLFDMLVDGCWILGLTNDLK